MMLEQYVGAYGRHEFMVDDLTTPEIDDFVGITWVFRVLGGAGAVADFDGVYDNPTVIVELDAEDSARLAPGFHRWFLIAQQTDADDIVAGEGTLEMKLYPAPPAV